MIIYIYDKYLTASGFTHCDSSTVHIYTQKNAMRQNTQNGTYITIQTVLTSTVDILCSKPSDNKKGFPPKIT
jgi:hypothetical protein